MKNKMQIQEATKQQISVEINNKRVITLSQDKHDGLILATGYRNEAAESEWKIMPGDFVMLMNYYRAQKEKGAEI